MTYPVTGAGDIGVNERKDIWFDCTQQLIDETGAVADSIDSVVWSVDVSGLTLSSQYISGVYAGVFVSTPTAGTIYRVKATVTTAAGRIFEALYQLAGVDKS